VEATADLLELAAQIPDLTLSALSVADDRYGWTAATASSHAEMEELLRPLARQFITVRVVDGETILTVEETR
jgi:hypothetical protein